MTHIMKMPNTRRLRSLCHVAAVFLLTSFPVWANDKAITIEGARIQGDQELPTVLYLVPWQPPVSPIPEAEVEQRIAETPIELLERNEFQRFADYHSRIDTEMTRQE